MIRGRDPGDVATHANGGLRPAAGRDVRGGVLVSCAAHSLSYRCMLHSTPLRRRRRTLADLQPFHSSLDTC